MDTNELFGKEKISKVLLKIAPPVMLAQLIQALYNIVDSLFVGNYSDSGPGPFRLTAQKIGGLCRKEASTRSDDPDRENALTYLQVPFLRDIFRLYTSP